MLVTLDLLTLFLLVAVGFYVFVANPRNRAHQTFAAFNSFLALWTVKDLLFWDFREVFGSPQWWMASSFIFGLLMQYSLVVFAWVFPENRRTPRKVAAVLFSPGLILIPAALSGALWEDATLTDGGIRLALSPSGYFFAAYIVFLFCFGSQILYRKYMNYRGTNEGAQVGAIIWGLAVTAVLQATCLVILPALGDYTLLPFSSLLVVPGVIFYAYAILNLKLFSLQSVLDQFRIFPLSYKIALTIAGVAAASFLAFQIPVAWFAFRNGMDFEAWRMFIVFSIISAMVPNLLLVLLVVRSIARPLRRITAAAVEVTKGSYGAQVDLRASNDEIGLLAESFNGMSLRMEQDLKRLHELNEHLLGTEKLAAIGTLAAGIAHEVNNPLASISSIIQRVGGNPDIDAATRADLALASGQIERISHVTRDMMDFARSRSETRSSVDVNSVIRLALRLVSFDRSFRRMEVSTDLAPDLPRIVADEDGLQQVFLNLLLNAKDATPEGGLIEVSSRVDGEALVVEVSDSGCGIGDEDAPRIFDPFFTTKPAGKGSGLGLTVCFGIVTAHGGRIVVRSDSNQGAAFSVVLPLATRDQSDPERPS